MDLATFDNIQFVLTVFIGVLTSLIASFVFFEFWTSRYTPQIELPDTLALGLSGKEFVLKIKIRNKVKRAAYDLRAEVHRERQVQRGDRNVQKTMLIPLLRSDPPIIEPKGDFMNDDTYIFVTRKPSTGGKDVKKAFKDYPDAVVRFRVIAIDRKSGIPRVFKKKYTWSDHIVAGEYKSGYDLTVDPDLIEKNMDSI